jgi:hypothetical protein
MEAIPLTPELAKEYRLPASVEGLLIDEVSLEAAESGLLAGDMVVSINDYPTPNLTAFTEATRRVQDLREATLTIFRRGAYSNLMIRSKRTLGFSQNESASPIKPGKLSPHRNRDRPCTDCHVIMQSGGQLPIDAGDITPPVERIRAGARPPHGYRGPCDFCHTVK